MIDEALMLKRQGAVVCGSPAGKLAFRD